MRKVVLTLLLLGLVAAAPEVQAGCCVVYQTCVVTCYRQEVREEPICYTVDHWVCRNVIDKVPCKVMVPHWVDEPREQICYRHVPRVIQRQVVRCCMVPVCCVDPCTGCPYVCMQPQTYVECVPCTIMECVPERQVVNVKVCRMVPQDSWTERCRQVWENHPRQVQSCRRYCVTVPYQTTVCVPVLVPCCGY